MTYSLFESAAVDAAELVVAWLAPLGSAGIIRRAGDTLPYRQVETLDPSEDADLEIADTLLSVHTFCARSDGWPAALDESQLTHRRMLELIRYRDTVTLSDGRAVSIDYGSVEEGQRHTDYDDDQILRYTGRYRIGHCYVPADAGS